MSLSPYMNRIMKNLFVMVNHQLNPIPEFSHFNEQFDANADSFQICDANERVRFPLNSTGNRCYHN